MDLTLENLPQSWINGSGSPSATAIVNQEYGGFAGQVVPDATPVTLRVVMKYFPAGLELGY